MKNRFNVLRMWRAPNLIVLLALFPLPGCFSYHRSAGSGQAAEPIAAEAWPAFDTEPLIPLLEMPAAIATYDFDRDTVRRFQPDATDEQLDGMFSDTQRDLTAARIDAHGLVRFWDYRKRPGSRQASDDDFMVFDRRIESFVRDGQYLSPAVAGYEREVRRIKATSGDDSGGFADILMKMYGISDNGFAEAWQLEDGLALGLPQPGDADRVGLLVHIASLIENRYEHDVLRRMESYGWAIAHMDSDIYLSGPDSLRAEQRSAERTRRVRELQEADPNDPRAQAKAENRIYTNQEIRLIGEAARARWETVNKELPPLDSGFEITPETDLSERGAQIAAAVDTRLAEHAYAAELLVRETDARLPELADRPILVMGFSAGALAAPTVAARLRELHPERRILVTLIGGGASVLDIAHGSTLTSGGIQLKPVEGDEPTPNQIGELMRYYESASRLDPLKAAAALRDIPVLHIYADKDTVVPTTAAERFNTAHGSVDRLVHKGDHDTLFYFLNSQASRIRSWLREQGVE